jgi:hypothetical protein
MKRMAVSNILIVGLRGLGVEIGAWASVETRAAANPLLQPRTSVLPVSSP